MRYKLRSSKGRGSVSDDGVSSPPLLGPSSSSATSSASTSSSLRSPPAKVRRKAFLQKPGQPTVLDNSRSKTTKTTIRSLPQEVILMIAHYLDPLSLLNFYMSSKWFVDMLEDCDTFWKILCVKEELANYGILEEDPPETTTATATVGWTGEPMRVDPPRHYTPYRRIFLKGLQMRRNIKNSNYQGWRIYANDDYPVAKLTPDLDMNSVKRAMGNFPKFSVNDDLKLDWDDRRLVVFHFFRGEAAETCIIRLWDIEDEPEFLYSVNKGMECITDKVTITGDYVVIVPSWPLDANALVMTLDVNHEMKEVGKYLFENPERKAAIDELWEHTQLRVVKTKAMVVCRVPEWTLIVVDLPSCELLCEISLDPFVSPNFDCQQIRSYKQVTIILFARKQNESSDILVTVDVTGRDTKLRSAHTCTDVMDVALFTGPEEIYLMKRNGNVVLFDANTKTETIKIKNDDDNDDDNNSNNLSEYQLFVNRKETICVMQSASEVPQGRYVKVYSYNEKHLYTINLDLCVYGMARDESICIYTNGAFLAAADSKKLILFNVKTGKYVGAINVPVHLERNKGKDDKDCMFNQTGLTLFIFDEDRLIAVHDYERSFPAVLDVYRFW